MLKIKSKKSSINIALIACVFAMTWMVSCNKYDKLPVVGKWECDIKELRGLDVDSCKETLLFNSGVDYTYVQDFIERKPGSLDKWQIKGNFERKNNKITFYNRVKDGTQPQPEVTYKYELAENDSLVLIVEGEGYPEDRKMYKRVN
ncbi:MAG: hypothetical protein PHC83_02775 [Bacteroidales bacterium]|nr:hypothetical protein [Bacteroidales bacterium]MDD4210082.1 hypothetical protein [Bacteroidales bacterium]